MPPLLRAGKILTLLASAIAGAVCVPHVPAQTRRAATATKVIWAGESGGRLWRWTSGDLTVRKKTGPKRPDFSLLRRERADIAPENREGDPGYREAYVEKGRVAVRISVPYGSEIHRGQYTQLGILLPIPPRLRQALAAAANRQAGFLMQDAPKLTRGQTSHFDLMSKPKQKPSSPQRGEDGF
jgi:hypothetical protein